MIGGLVDGNPFTRYPLLIARMDHLARNDELMTLLDASDWDLVIVDEVHRMSANWWAGELSTPARWDRCANEPAAIPRCVRLVI